VAGKAVITGAGIVSSLGDAPAAVHRALCEGRRGIRAFPDGAALAAGVGAAADVAYDLQPHFAARNVRPLDRTARLATAAAGLALSDSGLPMPSFPRDDVVSCSARCSAACARSRTSIAEQSPPVPST
jgi:3-oxoacyl-(acyl-carrier-protein) synthase